MHTAMLLFATLNCNAFTVTSQEHVPVGVGFYPDAALFNHACTPNCVATFRGRTLELRALRGIAPGDELTISYAELIASKETRQADLRTSYFFTCTCQRCTGSHHWASTEKYLQSLCCARPGCTGLVTLSLDDSVYVCEACNSSRDDDDLAQLQVTSLLAKADAAEKQKKISEAILLRRQGMRLSQSIYHKYHATNIIGAETLANMITSAENKDADSSDISLALDLYAQAIEALTWLHGDELVPLRGITTLKYAQALRAHEPRRTVEAAAFGKQACAMLTITHGDDSPIVSTAVDFLHDMQRDLLHTVISSSHYRGKYLEQRNLNSSEAKPFRVGGVAMDSTNQTTGSVGSVFLTEAKLRGHEFPTKELAELEPLVSGVSLMSQSTLLLKKRKELREVNDALEFMKEEYAQRVENCAERQREFERKQQEMRDQVSKFEKFIKENDSKRTRAELKAKTEHRSAEQNEVRKKQLVAQYEKDLGQREQLEKKRDQLLKYRTYLDSAVEASEQEYEEIADILNRYATLVDANNDLKVQVQSAESQIDRLRQDLRTFKTEMENNILVQNSEIHGHQQHLEKIRGETFQLDLDRGRDDRTYNDRSRESGQIVLAIKNLYNRCRTSMGGKIPPVTDQSVDAMVYMSNILKVVAERIVDLEYITTSYTPENPADVAMSAKPVKAAVKKPV
ncbi:hypothetical protein ACHHYP_03383 [Achlya hypogyna]|uniref:SET domain-containing protein n=1 Tax=Achlya hypogyna TaxID=1202772 RepID=A0A1V9ZRX9_ACHHY|nr:hypothetical protein ACHHYP_03383 [Achlya hypogyna]